MSAAAVFPLSRDGAARHETLNGATQAQVNNAIRAMAYLKTPDKVRAGVRNAYGYCVTVERVERILREIAPKRVFGASIGEPRDCDAFDYDYRVNPNSRVQVVETIKPRAAVFKRREPLPVKVPAPSANPFEGPFSIKRLAASIGTDMGLDPSDILGPKRARKFILARIVLTKLCIEQGIPCAAIGRKMGGRDHSTILHQRDIFEPYAALYPPVRACYERHVAMRAEAQAVAA